MVGTRDFPGAEADLSGQKADINLQLKAGAEAQLKLLSDSHDLPASLRLRSPGDSTQVPQLTLIDSTKAPAETVKGAPHGIIDPQHSIDSSNLNKSGRDRAVETDKSGNLIENKKLDNYVDRVVRAVSGNEGNFNSLNPNDTGHGISIGILQWNQKVGRLPQLLKAWHDRDPEDFKAIFGAHGKNLLKERWVRQHDIAGDKPLMKEIRRALANNKFQDIQMDLARDFVRETIKTGYEHGFRSELGLALVSDMVNQIGAGGMERAFRRTKLPHSGEIRNETESAKKLARAFKRADGHQRYSALCDEFSSVKTADL
jgi:hypothetical protein